MFKEYGFKKFDLTDMPLWEKYYEKLNGMWASSISIDSIWAWNDSIVTYYKIINDYLVVLAYDSANKRYVTLPLIGDYKDERFDDTFKKLIVLFEIMNIEFAMTDVYKWMLDRYLQVKDVKIKYEYDEGLSDYIYTKKDFLEALNNQDNRYNIKYFMKKYNPVITQMQDSDADECIEFIKEVWCGENECSGCEYGCLKITAENIIRHISECSAKGIVIRSEGKIIAYCIVSAYEDVIMFHFKKTARHYRGINEVLHKECMERFASEGTRFINYTEDMNHEGLRKYKQRIAKYSLEPKYEIYL